MHREITDSLWKDVLKDVKGARVMMLGIFPKEFYIILTGRGDRFTVEAHVVGNWKHIMKLEILGAHLLDIDKDQKLLEDFRTYRLVEVTDSDGNVYKYEGEKEV